MALIKEQIQQHLIFGMQAIVINKKNSRERQRMLPKWNKYRSKRPNGMEVAGEKQNLEEKVTISTLTMKILGMILVCIKNSTKTDSV